MSSKYERELRDILMGDVETIETISKTMDERSTEAYRTCIDKPFLIMRGAGSLGIDLFATRKDVFFAIEEKSYSNRMYFSDQKRLKEQHQVFEEYAEEIGLPYIYGFRKKGKSGEKWAVFRSQKSKIGRVIGDETKLPLIPQTTHDSRYLSYDEGLPLSRFIEILRGVLDEYE